MKLKGCQSEIVKLHKKNGLIEQYAANAVAAITGGPAAVSTDLKGNAREEGGIFIHLSAFGIFCSYHF